LQTFRSLTELVNFQITSFSLIPLIRAEIKESCKVIAKDGDELRTMKKLILNNLDKRFPISASTKLATLLDPGTKSLLDLTDDAKEELLYRAITDEAGI